MTKYCFEINENSLDEKEMSLLKKILESSKKEETPSVETTSSGEGIDTGSVSETSAGSTPAQPSSEGEKSGST